MAAMDFPAAPTVGQLYPATPIAGIPQYKWDGTVWVAVLATEMQNYVQRTGDTMTGALTMSGASAMVTLAADPTAVLHAATKQYVDGGVGGVGGGLTAKVDKAGGAGGIMTGLLTLSADPTAVLHAATKQYVDAGDVAGLAAAGMQINGGMDVSQERGTTNLNVAGYICDGWRMDFAGTMGLSAGQNLGNPVPGISYLVYVACVVAQPSMGAGDLVLMHQFIEGYRIARLGWGTVSAQPITVGFWTGHFRAGTYSVAAHNGAGNRSCVVSYTHNVSNAWEYKIITIPGDVAGTWAADNTKGIQLVFTIASGSSYVAPSSGVWAATGAYNAVTGQVNGVTSTSDAFRITGVVILPGTQTITAAQSPLLMRPYDHELLTCQRYYQRIDTVQLGSADANFAPVIFLPTTMRATPTVTNNGAAVWAPQGPGSIKQSTPTGGFMAITLSMDARL